MAWPRKRDLEVAFTLASLLMLVWVSYYVRDQVRVPPGIWATVLVLSLSIVPVVENRGAMITGFALGVVDWQVYLAGTLLNIASIPLWARLLGKIPMPIKGIGRFGTKNYRMAATHQLPVLVAMPHNGVNMASVLYFFPKIFKRNVEEAYLPLSLGIILRGITSYLFLVGIVGFMSITDVLLVLVAWSALSYLARRLKMLG